VIATGLVDPQCGDQAGKAESRFAGEIRDRAKRGEEFLVTTLTKRMSEIWGYYTRWG